MPQLPKGYVLSQVTGVGIDNSQNIFLFHRTGRQWTDPFPDSLISSNTILMLDREKGKILNSWGANLFIMPHGLAVEGEALFHIRIQRKVSLDLYIKHTIG